MYLAEYYNLSLSKLRHLGGRRPWRIRLNAWARCDRVATSIERGGEPSPAAKVSRSSCNKHGVTTTQRQTGEKDTGTTSEEKVWIGDVGEPDLSTLLVPPSQIEGALRERMIHRERHF